MDRLSAQERKAVREAERAALLAQVPALRQEIADFDASLLSDMDSLKRARGRVTEAQAQRKELERRAGELSAQIYRATVDLGLPLTPEGVVKVPPAPILKER